MYKPIKEIPLFMNWVYHLLPYLIFVVTACFSATGAYDYYKEADQILSYVIAGVFVGIGVCFTLAVSKWEYTLKLTKKICWFTATTMGALLMFWLSVSSLYNFSFISMPRAVTTEIAEKVTLFETKLTPVMLNSDVVNNTLLRSLDDSITSLENSINTQQDLGGCHEICQVIKEAKVKMESFENDLSGDYDESKAKEMRRSLIQMSNLALDNDVSWQDKLRDYVSLALKLKNTSSHFLIAPSPIGTLNKALNTIRVHKSKLNNFNSVSSEVAKNALLDANLQFSAIENILIDIQPRLISLKDHEPLVFSPITASSVLLFKHIKHSLDLVVLACFLDLTAIFLILNNIVVYRKINYPSKP